MRSLVVALLTASLVLLALACQDEEEAPETPTPTSTITATPRATPTPAITPTPEATPTPVATVIQETGDIGEVVRYAPTTAANLGVREMRSNGVSFAELAYTITSQVFSPGVGPEGGSREFDRQYLELYSWDGQAWNPVFNLYDLAERLYTPDNLGPVVEGQPQEDAALVTGSITPVSGVVEVGDVLVLETTLMLGPRGYQHPSPTISVLRCDATGCTVLWTREFAVRGGLVHAAQTGTGLELTVQAYLPDDPLCCPNGWEMVRLVPMDEGLLSEVAQCVGPAYESCLPFQ